MNNNNNIQIEESGTISFNDAFTPQYKLEVFEGPLDLLLRLISRNKVDIMDIPISLILDQYMEYVAQLQQVDPDVAGDFIAMAAELMLIKSKMLLPGNDSAATDPRAELVRDLMDYKRAKEAAKDLSALYQRFSGRMAKESEEIDVDKTFVAPQELDYLFAAFERIERRKKLMEISHTDEPEKTLKTIATKKITPIYEKTFSMLRHLAKNGPTSFDELILRNETRSDIVATFVAMLQLIRRGMLKISTDDPENPILEINYERNKFTADV